MNKFKLIDLPYDLEALEPAVSRNTLMFHHGKHLQTYVNNLNALLPDSEFEGKSLEEIVTTAEGPIFNNAGQILNHNMYFEELHSTTHKVMPEGKLYDAICEQFADFESFPKSRMISYSDPVSMGRSGARIRSARCRDNTAWPPGTCRRN